MSTFKAWKDAVIVDVNQKLTLPKILSCDKISIRPSQDNRTHTEGNSQTADTLPLAVTNAYHVYGTLKKRAQSCDGKEILIISLDLAGKLWQYEPGDTIGILPVNKPDDVNKTLQCLDITSIADQPIEINNNDSKRNYLPKISNYREVLTKYVNIHALPLKQVIATLALHTSDALDRRKMEMLASREGASDYTRVILEAGSNCLDILLNVPTCKPPFETFIQLLPRLLPRPYSIASSPLSAPGRILITLSVLPEHSEGICSGMLRRMFSDATETSFAIYLRRSNGFRLPDDNNVPLILIGPGTGVAPYVGFLDHIHETKTKRQVYLFTGYQEESDFLFLDAINNHLNNGTLTKLYVSYSRQDGPHPKYVQEALLSNWQDVGNAISEGGYIYVCGDFGKFRKTISDAIATVLEKHLGLNNEFAIEHLKALKKQERYLEDIWL